MRAYGIKIEQGSVIQNANVEHGDSFPAPGTETKGQLFFRDDENILYYRNNNNTYWIPISTGGIREINQPNHGFDKTDVGAPIYYDTRGSGNSSVGDWKLAIASVDEPEKMPSAVLANVIDDDNFMYQQTGTVVGIRPSVIEDGPKIIPGKIYYASTTNYGKVRQTKPDPEEIISEVYLGIGKFNALILNNAAQMPLALNDLTNVDAHPSKKGTSVLTWDAVKQMWVAAPSTDGAAFIGELNDVSIELSPESPENPTPGEIPEGNAIKWDSVQKQWVHGPVVGKSVITDRGDGVYTFENDTDSVLIDTRKSLGELEDVDVSSLRDGNVIVWDEENGMWTTSEGTDYASIDEVREQDVSGKAIDPITAAEYLLRTNSGENRNQVINNTVEFLSDLVVGAAGVGNGKTLTFKGGGVITGSAPIGERLVHNYSIMDGGSF